MRRHIIPGLALAVLSVASAAEAATLEAQYNNYWTGTVTAYVRPNTERDVFRFGKATIVAPQAPEIGVSGTNTYTIGFAHNDSPTMTYCEYAVDVGYRASGGSTELASCVARTIKGGADGATCAIRYQLDYTARKCVAEVDIR